MLARKPHRSNFAAMSPICSPFVRILLLLVGCLPQLGSAETLPGKWITTDGFQKRDLVFLAGSRDLVYTQESSVTGGMQIMRMNLESGQVVRYFEKDPPGNREFSISKDGNVFAYNVVQGLSSRIHVVSSAVEATIPKLGKHPWANWPAVSPDGKQVTFVQGARVIYQFDVIETPGRQRIRRLSIEGAEHSDYWPRYSPDGKQIVFASNRDGDFEIYLMDSDGLNQRRLTESQGIDMHPTFSPDGESITFTSNRDGNYEIYRMRLSDRRTSRITFNPERDDYSRWHPSDGSLWFVSEHGGRFDVRKVEATWE